VSCPHLLQGGLAGVGCVGALCQLRQLLLDLGIGLWW
jgi:hypothetical protein